MRACTVFTQHIWAGEYTVTQRTELETDAVGWEVVKAVDEGSERIERRGHVHSQDLVLRLCILHHELQDTNTLAGEKIYQWQLQRKVRENAPGQGNGQTRLSTEVRPCYECHR